MLVFITIPSIIKNWVSPPIHWQSALPVSHGRCHGSCAQQGSILANTRETREKRGTRVQDSHSSWARYGISDLPTSGQGQGIWCQSSGVSPRAEWGKLCLPLAISYRLVCSFWKCLPSTHGDIHSNLDLCKLTKRPELFLKMTGCEFIQWMTGQMTAGNFWLMVIL